jgi:cell division protein FtsN
MAKPVRRSAPPRRSGGSFLLGVFIGILLGLGIALAVAFYLNKTPLPFLGKSRPAGDGKEAVLPQKPIAGMPQGGAKGPERDKPKFDFYKILPGGEEPVTEKELKDASKAGKGQPEAARIALLGFESIVDPTPLPDKGTWYRVRMGPYTSLEDMNRVRRVLSQNGIDASLVKAKDPAAKDN